MPRLMPNENAIIYGKETRSDDSRQKRAIPLGLIFSGVSAIGGLIMKGVNAWSNYKKSKAMTEAVEKLYEAQEINFAINKIIFDYLQAKKMCSWTVQWSRP